MISIYSLSQLGEVQGNGASAKEGIGHRPKRALGIGHWASGIGHYQLLITNSRSYLIFLRKAIMEFPP
ncbi:MAG: hypothetical protein QQW96_13460 [Tychonema bourrellyi B0820]|uniref:hypothetical protein n=1 Tax=Tychonema bourrellyi TaxID=54313 RepID=UPI0015D4CE42|nr:hypothetical protein [Tychonema bourrellyi]MDQ2098642.1 hypothetical protein [Tychonema bourrellyi B0820]